MRHDFEAKLRELDTPCFELNTKYCGYLEKQRKLFQDSGNLKGVLAIQEENKSIDGDNRSELSAYPELSRLQKIYQDERAVLEKKKLIQTLALIETYKKKTSVLATEFTKANKIEAAKLAMNQWDKFSEMNTALMQGKKANLESREVLENSLGMKMVRIQPGKFKMGSPPRETGRKAELEEQVEVTLTEEFWICQHEVTQEQFQEIMGVNPSTFKEDGEQRPVERVSWHRAMEFCKHLTERDRRKRKLPSGWHYTLPTEAQWEYACRAGTTGPYSGRNVDSLGWHRHNSEGRTQPVGQKKPNAWGLFDMHGNVREWSRDCISNRLPGGVDPVGPVDGDHRVPKGGSWDDHALNCRSGSRFKNRPSHRGPDIGFRVAMVKTKDE